IEEQGTGGIPPPDKRPEFSHCLFPEWTEPNLATLSTDLHRARARCVPGQILDQNTRGLGGSSARVVEEQKQGVISLAPLNRAVWSTKKLIDLVFFHARDRIAPRSFKWNSTNLCTPVQMLWARLACEPSESVEGSKPLIPRGNRATSNLFQVR